MIKKALIIFLIIIDLNGRIIENELGISVTTTSINNSKGSKFKNYGISTNYELRKYIVMPRFDLDYIHISDFYDKSVNSLFKFSINGLYEFENRTILTPYALAGIGYEHVASEIKDVFESHPFFQGGLGVSYRLNYGYKFNFEGKMLQILGGKDEDNEVIMNFGISIPIKKLTQKRKIRRVKAKPKIIIKKIPIIKERVVIKKVNSCPKKIDRPDRDRDGIEDRIDQCPATPCGYIVDRYGCPIRVTLRVNFAVNSSNIDYASIHKIRGFAQYLLSNRDSRVTIVGHTDSDGSSSDNMILSINRARAVANKLIEFGVNPNRISAIGKGESMPIASNASKEGKRLNRRIEAIIIYPTRRDSRRF